MERVLRRMQRRVCWSCGKIRGHPDWVPGPGGSEGKRQAAASTPGGDSAAQCGPSGRTQAGGRGSDLLSESGMRERDPRTWTPCASSLTERHSSALVPRFLGGTSQAPSTVWSCGAFWPFTWRLHLPLANSEPANRISVSSVVKAEPGCSMPSLASKWACPTASHSKSSLRLQGHTGWNPA